MVNNKRVVLITNIPFIVHHSSFLYTVFWLLFLYRFYDCHIADKYAVISFMSFCPAVVVITINKTEVQVLSDRIRNQQFRRLLLDKDERQRFYDLLFIA